jgi:alkylation response protein AidB-like acyl-CoA dehydrogenase
MDIALTDEQIAYRDGFRAWLDENLRSDWDWPAYRGPKGEDEEAEFHKAWERKLYEAGYAGIAWPKGYGGQGLTQVENLIVAEELGLRAAPEGVSIIGTEVAGPLLLVAGTEEQKKHFIPRLLRLEDTWCQGFSESNAGSDLAALKTRAVRYGDDWIITGQKIWTSYAQHADICIVLARSNPDAPRHRGLTLFMVDMKSPGISVRPIVQITGRREFNEIFFDNVRVADSIRVGEVNAGWDLAMTVLSLERASTRMHRNGRYMHEFNHLVEICKNPGPRGDRLIDNPHFRQRLAEVYADIEIHRYYNIKTVSLIGSGRQVGPEASIVKLQWSELHQRMSELALDLLDGAAMGGSSDAIRWRDIYLQSRSDTIYAGTSEIQRNIIAERILELPR